MRVYVASRFSPEGIAAVRRMHALLREHGHEVTHDWTREDADGREGDELRAYLGRCAQEDVAGVCAADATILIDKDNQRMRGAYVEFGIALGLRQHLITVGAAPGTLGMPGGCIFFELPQVHNVATPEEAVALLDATARRAA